MSVPDQPASPAVEALRQRYLTIEEVAQFLGITERAVRNLDLRYITIARQRLYPLDWFEADLRDHVEV